MDKELNDYFTEYDIDVPETEERFNVRAAAVSEKFERKMRGAGKGLRFAQDILALYRYFLDAGVPWQRKAVIVAALLYFISPLDTIPDLAPFIGYLDDFGVIAAVTAFMSSELTPYYPVVKEPPQAGFNATS